MGADPGGSSPLGSSSCLFTAGQKHISDTNDHVVSDRFVLLLLCHRGLLRVLDRHRRDPQGIGDRSATASDAFMKTLSTCCFEETFRIRIGGRGMILAPLIKSFGSG